MQKINGFTLMELLVVMVIASTLTLTAIDGWQQWQHRQRLNTSARQLQHFLLRLRNEANWHNQRALLWQQHGEVWCVGSGPFPSACSVQRRVFVAPWPEVRLIRLTEGMGFYGRRNVAKPGRIVIASEAGERHIIVSSRARVRICEASCL
ncbi:prepilin-type N-terminal cleavage/methylation domain-containing protein [Erwinia psidii]|uniref:Prepilin-type N-terminal cleavage/methylation domain-containing protein n=2 Tax=Erwinia psidii TaxID=69224 RepID=A0A3N6SMY2_9GAMM|nr:prepilin-type N-terminal cleavage/methylation domain-containing protein [Erwinia psidii]MCX8956877.1 prepilin-type N-terminal cleavage/methylation domain-containing protein [Erwinia psidii]MCX8960312.1 prepilin-type N-terminal cleavage/methylation domain-containing protein [Erwinia psidii]MCX8964508.1 prepilin-type N-terminal cleavage/methylation domain-containing protein [Erwinia psidii]RQM40251.1 prepilin-type N-terminal cleavage/methylation domain-containing protein [Erwinia psidii]